MTPTTSDILVRIQGREESGWVPLGGRLLLASIFLVAGCRKFGDTATFTAYMASFGVPVPDLLLPPATALEIGASILMAAGLWTRWAALALASYTLVLAAIFHAFWAVEAKQFQAQLNLFLFHLETIGGLLLLVTYGGGPLSVDHLLVRQRRR